MNAPYAGCAGDHPAGGATSNWLRRTRPGNSSKHTLGFRYKTEACGQDLFPRGDGAMQDLDWSRDPAESVRGHTDPRRTTYTPLPLRGRPAAVQMGALLADMDCIQARPSSDECRCAPDCRRSSTLSLSPALAAKKSGVRPARLRRWTEAPCERNSRTMSTLGRVAARCCTVRDHARSVLYAKWKPKCAPTNKQNCAAVTASSLLRRRYHHHHNYDEGFIVFIISPMKGKTYHHHQCDEDDGTFVVRAMKQLYC